MHVIHSENRRRVVRAKPRWRRIAFQAVRWGGRSWTFISSFLFLALVALFVRSLFASDGWHYSSEGGGDIDIITSGGRITANLLASEDTHWLYPRELSMSPGNGRFYLDAYWQADNVLGAMWRITSWWPAIGIVSVPMIYPFVFFALVPSMWIAQRLLRKKRIFPPWRVILRTISAAGPWACVLTFYLLGLAAYFDRPQFTLSCTDGWSISRSRFQTVLNSYPGGADPAIYAVKPGSYFLGLGTRELSWAGVEFYVYRDPHGGDYWQLMLPWWPVFVLLAIWPALVLRRRWGWWRSSAGGRFPVT